MERKCQVSQGILFAEASFTKVRLRTSIAKTPIKRAIEKLININSKDRKRIPFFVILGSVLLISYLMKTKTTMLMIKQAGIDKCSLTRSFPMTNITHAAVIEATSLGRKMCKLSQLR